MVTMKNMVLVHSMYFVVSLINNVVMLYLIFKIGGVQHIRVFSNGW